LISSIQESVFFRVILWIHPFFLELFPYPRWSEAVPRAVYSDRFNLSQQRKISPSCAAGII
jgi:hypothetical protein